MNRPALAIAAMLPLALAACGQREALRPPEGGSLPPRPAHAAAAPAAADLLTPRTDERPLRSEELLLKSQERPDDRFDLPPPG